MSTLTLASKFTSADELHKSLKNIGEWKKLLVANTAALKLSSLMFSGFNPKKILDTLMAKHPTAEELIQLVTVGLYRGNITWYAVNNRTDADGKAMIVALQKRFDLVIPAGKDVTKKTKKPTVPVAPPAPVVLAVDALSFLRCVAVLPEIAILILNLSVAEGGLGVKTGIRDHGFGIKHLPPFMQFSNFLSVLPEASLSNEEVAHVTTAWTAWQYCFLWTINVGKELPADERPRHLIDLAHSNAAIMLSNHLISEEDKVDFLTHVGFIGPGVTRGTHMLDAATEKVLKLIANAFHVF